MIIESILINNKNSRDNDLILFQEYLKLKYENKYYGLLAIDLLNDINEGRINNFDSVSRVRRKLQENNVQLRGNRWDKRHKISETYTTELF